MLQSLNTRLKILTIQEIANSSEIESLKNHFNVLPPDYINLVSTEGTEIEFQLDKSDYLRIWNPNGCIQMMDAYKMEKYIPLAFPFGDNGGGQFFAFFNEDKMNGIFKIDYGDIGTDNVIYIASNLEKIIVHGDGLDRIANW
jgi:hypothetical protein